MKYYISVGTRLEEGHPVSEVSLASRESPITLIHRDELK